MIFRISFNLSFGVRQKTNNVFRKRAFIILFNNLCSFNRLVYLIHIVFRFTKKKS